MSINIDNVSNNNKIIFGCHYDIFEELRRKTNLLIYYVGQNNQKLFLS